MSYLFTSESVSEGHPDKVADQISDALLDHFLAFDNQSKVACETLVTTGLTVLSGEVKTKSKSGEPSNIGTLVELIAVVALLRSNWAPFIDAPETINLSESITKPESG